MADFLTERTKFSCTASPAVNFNVSAGGKVEHKGAKVLTTSAKLSGMGICPILTLAAQGVQQPCKFQQTAWMNFDFTRKANGKNLLTDKSFCNCPVGSAVKVLTSVAMRFVTGNFSAHSALSITLPAVEKNISEQKNSAVDEKKFSIAEKNFSSNKKIVQENNATFENKPVEKNYNLKCLNCDRKECKYRLESFGALSDEVKNDSSKLEKNYLKYLATTKNFSSADLAYKNSLEFPNFWSYQAHHVISGNQVFKQVPEVVKVANLCKYDINCAENCIMLPSRREGHGNLSELSKSASAFDVMSVTGMQWHLGTHSYSFNLEEIQEMKKQIEQRTGKPGKVKTYAELLTVELKKIKFAGDEKICPAQFITRMNKLSARVREKLAAFGENPASSYPYYVSREAYLFAFKVPRLRKFIAVRKNADGLNLKLYKTVGTGDNISLKKDFSSNDASEIIKFCGNVQHFILLGDTSENDLPFASEFFRKTADFNFDEVSEIIVWLRKNPVENYVAPAKKIFERLEKLK